MPSPQAYLVQAVRRVWRWSAARRECLKNAKECYVCGTAFKQQPVYSIKKTKEEPPALNGGYSGPPLYDLFRNKKYVSTNEKRLVYRKKKEEIKAWRKLYAPQADHVIGVGAAPKDWTGWDTYLQRMFGHTLLPICRKCHLKKNGEERAKRNAEKKKEKNG